TYFCANYDYVLYYF
nr:immunoglobulin heavy chain junction region [Mus musculus]